MRESGCRLSAGAKASLDTHRAMVARAPWAKVRFDGRIPQAAPGTFLAPMIVEIDRPERLDREVFGPILHVIRWPADRLDAVLDEIAATGYALTLGIHSRIDETARRILDRLGVGNSYVNRNMIGAVVGAQPFGGERLSGTGPKAGGPRYLHRFATERTVSVDTTAAGGNATLMSLDDAAG